MRRVTADRAVPVCEVASGTPVKAPVLPLPVPNPKVIQPALRREAKAEIEPSAAWGRTGVSTPDPAFAERLQSWLLRGGLAFVLSYAATSSLVHPEAFAGYFPSFIPTAWATELLPLFAVFEVLLALGLMTARYAYVACTLAGLTMLAILAVNLDAFDVLFRNVAIACGAFTLAVQTRPERGVRRPGKKPLRRDMEPARLSD
jgi:uncharacterized membrane protein